MDNYNINENEFLSYLESSKNQLNDQIHKREQLTSQYINMNLQEQHQNICNKHNSNNKYKDLFQENELQNMVDKIKNNVLQDCKIKDKKYTQNLFLKKKVPTNKIQQDDFKKSKKSLALKDKIELKLLNKINPCVECSFFLSKGQSTQSCQFHGKPKRPNSALPRRLQPY